MTMLFCAPDAMICMKPEVHTRCFPLFLNLTCLHPSLRVPAGRRREIRVQVCVRPRGLVLHGLSRQSAARAEDGHGTADQRGGHSAAVTL